MTPKHTIKNIFRSYALTISITSILWMNIGSALLGSTALIHIPHGTKANGMGGAYTAIAVGSNQIFYNWATPQPTHQTQRSLEQASKLEVPYYTLSLHHPFSIKHLQFGLLYSQVNGIEESTLNTLFQPVLTGNTFAQKLYTLYGAYRFNSPFIYSGLRYTLFYESIQSETGLSHQLDLALYKSISLGYYPIDFTSVR